MAKLPKKFKHLFWGYKFSSLDSKEDKYLIVVNTLNYGDLDHWRWLVKTYGKRNLRKMIREEIPASEFRSPSTLKLVCLLFNLKSLKYASRSDKIKAKKGL